MIEGNHAAGAVVGPRVAGSVFPQGIPPFPDGRTAHLHLVQPGWARIGQKHLAGVLAVTVIRQGKQDERSSWKSGADMVVIIPDQADQMSRRLLFILCG